MTIKEILQFPHPMLVRAADPVENFDDNIATLSTDMRETAKAFRAEGLAANQVGALYRMFVIRDGTTQEYITCINPVILAKKTDEIDAQEGCLSFPGVQERIKRAEAVQVQFQDEGGEVVTRWLTGVNAVAFQHELDHLEGILFTDHMGKTQKRLALKRFEKVKRITTRNHKNIMNMMNKEIRKIQVARQESDATVETLGE